MKNADSVRVNEKAQHLTHPVVLIFSTLSSAGINDHEGPEKCNNTEVKYGATFYG
jgi:hypothetical protein